MQPKHKWLYLLPAMILMGILYAYPLVLTLLHSFQRVSLFGQGSEFVGFANYQKLWRDPQLYRNLTTTVKYTFITVLLKILGGLSFALFLNGDFYLKKLWRFLMILPWTIPQVAVAVIWKWIYDGKYGYLNELLLRLHLITDKVSWLADPDTTFYMVALVDAWMGWPLITLMFLAGLEAISPTLYEAASIDGAGPVQKFCKVTLPSIRPITLVLTILVTIWTFNSFNVIYILTQGGPLRTTETLMLRVYLESFKNFDFGVSSALSMLVILLLIALTYQYVKLLMREDGS